MNDVVWVSAYGLPGAELARRFGVSHRTINEYRRVHGWDKGRTVID